MTKIKKLKVAGKTLSNQPGVKTGQVLDEHGTPLNFSVGDQAVINKIEEMHAFFIQRNVPYMIVARTPDSNKPLGKFSFNHQQKQPQATLDNAEWVFNNLGSMINQITRGVLRLVKFY